MRALRGKKKQDDIPNATLHESVPHVAFELALYRMRFTQDDTTEILSDYLRELGA